MLVGAPSAQAAASASGCPQHKLSRPFLRWHDPAQYVLAPQGDFEQVSDWRLSGAQRVLGNEIFYVHDDDDRFSLSLPPGSSARSPDICVSVTELAIRFFVRNTGSKTSTLKVEVLYESLSGDDRSAVIAKLLGGEVWAPSTQIPIVVNGLSLSSAGDAYVAFRFTPSGSGGAWQIDDLYVDPYRKG